MSILGIKGAMTFPSLDSLMDTYKVETSETGSFLFYGKSGSGKTTLARTFPNPVFIDTDRGMNALKEETRRFKMETVDKPFLTVLTILKCALEKSGPFGKDGKYADCKTLVIDSWSSLIDDYMMPEAMVEGNRSMITEKASYDEYGRLASRQTLLSSLVKDLAKQYYVITTAITEEEKDDNTGELQGKPKVTGKYRDKIMADYDEVYYLESQDVVTAQGKQTRYMLYAKPFRHFQAKTRKTSISTMESPTFEKIKATYKK